MVQELLKHIVRNLVDDPLAVTVIFKEINGKRVLEIVVASQDFGRVIGKEGRTFKAIQALGAAISSLHERDIILNLV